MADAHQPSSTGRIATALLASLGVHAALLASFDPAGRGGPLGRTTPTRIVQIDARLEPMVTSAFAPPTAPAKVATNAPQGDDSMHPARIIPQPAMRQQPIRTPARTEPKVEATVTPAPAAPALPSKEIRDTRVAGLESQRQGSIAEPSDIESVDQYRLAVIFAARRLQGRAVTLAPKGIGGRVGVQLAIGANGVLRGARIIKSSGDASLDDQALELLLRSRDETPVPPALSRREFEIAVTIVFEGGR